MLVVVLVALATGAVLGYKYGEEALDKLKQLKDKAKNLFSK